jgi:hypothetical protein
LISVGLIFLGADMIDISSRFTSPAWPATLPGLEPAAFLIRYAA